MADSTGNNVSDSEFLKNRPFLILAGIACLVVGLVGGMLVSRYIIAIPPADPLDTYMREVTARHEAEDKTLEIRTEAVRGQVEMSVEIHRLRDQLQQSLQETAAVRQQLVTAREKAAQIDKTPVQKESPSARQSLTGIQVIGEENLEARDWESRYKYAAYKYNKLVSDYDKLQKKYIVLTGADGGSKGIVTGAQFYQSLKESNKQEINDVWNTIRKGVRTGKKKELELHQKELEDRERWIRSMARRYGIEK